jgi:putative endonuclease
MKPGALAEHQAAQYLQQHGLELLAQNYRCRFGEIDLIMQDGKVLVFVEVRLRHRADFGGAAASIDQRKQQRIVLAAQHYLTTLRHTPPCRFDAVLVDGTEHKMQWLKNAFDAA